MRGAQARPTEARTRSDGLPAVLLCRLGSSIAQPLTRIFSLCLKHHSSPKVWRESTVVPVEKIKNPKEPKNFRPISLTCASAKLLENIITQAVNEHVDDTAQHAPMQHAYRAGRSVESRLLVSSNYIARSLNESVPVDVVFLDCARAFESPPHAAIVSRLRQMRIHPDVCSFFENGFYANRTFRVKVEDAMSTPRRVLSGVPQGCPSSCWAFSYYLAPVADACKSALLLAYADDLCLLMQVPDDAACHALQADLSALAQRLRERGLVLSPSKCAVLHAGHGNRGHVYSIDGSALPTTDVQRDIGVLCTPEFDLEAQTAQTVASCNVLCRQINSAFKYASAADRVMLYKVYVRTKLDFASTVTSPYRAGQIAEMESVQRLFTRFLPGARGLEYAQRLELFGLETTESRRRYLDLMYVWRLLWGYVDIDFRQFFLLASECEDAHRMRTRGHALKLKVLTTPRREVYKNSFAHRVVEPFNDLPADIAELRNPNNVKAALMRHVLRYSLSADT